jgi:hypothetical protein
MHSRISSTILLIRCPCVRACLCVCILLRACVCDVVSPSGHQGRQQRNPNVAKLLARHPRSLLVLFTLLNPVEGPRRTRV